MTLPGTPGAADGSGGNPLGVFLEGGAIAEDEGVVLPVCAWVDGQYGISDVYLGVPARLGRGGVTEIVELDLTEDERAALHAAAEAVRDKHADGAPLA